MKNRIQITNLSILITIASTTLYIVFRNLGREIGSFAFLWAPLSLIFILINRPFTLIRGPIKIIIIYGFFMVGILQFTLWKYMNEWNQIHILYEFYYLTIVTIILSYYLGRGDYRKLAWLSKWTFIFIILSLITTNIALYFDSYLVRQSADTNEFSTYQEKIYKYTGAMSYSYMQSMVCLIPILIYHIKTKKKMVFAPRILIFVLLLIFITLIRAQVFANVLVSLLITILTFVGSKKRIITFVSISLLAIILLTIPKSIYASISTKLSTYFDPNSEMYFKLKDFAVFIEDPEFDNSTGAGNRAARYPLLFEVLLAEPILGESSHASQLNISGGAHLYWMNRLAMWGIPGFIFFIFVLFKIFKKILSLFDISFKYYYYISLLAFILLGLFKSIGGREPWLILIVIIPGLYFLSRIQQVKKVNINQTYSNI
jgi:hypothetical protein